MAVELPEEGPPDVFIKCVELGVAHFKSFPVSVWNTSNACAWETQPVRMIVTIKTDSMRKTNVTMDVFSIISVIVTVLAGGRSLTPH